MSHQFILDENQNPLFAIIPYCEYAKRFLPEQPIGERESSPKGIPRFISLPNGGPDAAIDLPRLVDYWVRKGILSMPINQRAKPLKDFTGRERFSVEALVRVCFVSESYQNTMQMINEVTHQLVATGLFEEVKYDCAQIGRDNYPFDSKMALVTEGEREINVERYTRAVKSLKINVDRAVDFYRENPVDLGLQIQ